MALGRFALCSFVSLSAACSWTRYDEQGENAPIVQLKKPEAMGEGFGVSLATVTVDQTVYVLVGGSPNVSSAAVFSLGTSDKPVQDTVDTGHCDDDGNLCFLGKTVFGAATLPATDGMSHDMSHDLCFVNGIGETPEDKGLLVRCDDDFEFSLLVPPQLEEAVFAPAINPADAPVVAIAGDRAAQPSVVAGVARERIAWYVPPDSRVSHELQAGTLAAEGMYGSAVGVALVASSSRVVAVGAPEKAAVYLFRAEGANAPTLLGCIGGPPGFGRTIAAGPVIPGHSLTTEDLVIADDFAVHVFDASKLADIQPTGDVATCTLGGLAPETLFASFSCGSDKDTAGCSASEFGAALAIGDIDGDGDGEVVVGAPRMRARGQDNAGAILVYDVEDPRRERIKDVLFMSSAETDDDLGRSVATAFTGARHVIVGGAPGNGKTAVFYCTSGLPADLRGSRCL